MEAPISISSAETEAGEPKSLIEKLRARFSSSASNLERMRGEVEQNSRAMRLAETELKRLMQEHQNAAARLQQADTTLEARKAEVIFLEGIYQEAWGDPGSLNGPNYTNIVSLRASIEDFPRCRKVLAANFEATKRALRDFERKNST